MKKTVCLLLFLVLGCSIARAQNPNAKREPILQLDEAARARLDNLRLYGGVSVDITRQELEKSPFATADLMRYVRDGGVVFLHTNAAALFGYVTVPAGDDWPDAQISTQSLLYFGAHPLLRSREKSDFSRGLPGVSQIQFRLAPADVLVTSHPFATALLRAVGPQMPDDSDLIALAVAPFGRGWAIFSPAEIDASGDGAWLIRNLTEFAAALQRLFAALATRICARF